MTFDQRDEFLYKTKAPSQRQPAFSRCSVAGANQCPKTLLDRSVCLCVHMHVCLCVHMHVGARDVVLSHSTFFSCSRQVLTDPEAH